MADPPAPSSATPANEGFDPAFFAYLATVEDTHFWFVARSALIVDLAQRYCPDAQSLFEIGCGNGVVLRALAESRPWRQIVATDAFADGLDKARQRVPGAAFAQRDATEPADGGPFDLVGAFDVLEHIRDDEAVLRAAAAALTPGGGLILSVPQHPWLWSPEDDAAHHQRRYRRGELEAKLQRAGFEIVFSSSYVVLLLPLMLLSRLRSRAAFDFRRQFAIARPLNRLLLGITRMETAMTRAGMRWPFGGSRVIVARKGPGDAAARAPTS